MIAHQVGPLSLFRGRGLIFVIYELLLAAHWIFLLPLRPEFRIMAENHEQGGGGGSRCGYDRATKAMTSYID